MSTELIQVETSTVIDLYTKGEALDPLIESVRKTVESFEHDLSTQAGRKRTASLAAKVSKAKTFLDGLGKDLVSDWKQKAKVVDNERKRMREALDALRDQARAPLTELEEKEAEEQAKKDSFIADIRAYMEYPEGQETSSLYEARLKSLESVEIGDWLGDLEAQAHREKTGALAWLRTKIESMKKMEEEAAEEIRRQAEAAEKARIEREAQIRKEAEARVMMEAEKMKREAEEAERRAIVAKEEAEKRAKEAEIRALRAKEEALRSKPSTKITREMKTEAKLAIMQLGIDEIDAVNVVIAIIDGRIPHVRMTL